MRGRHSATAHVAVVEWSEWRRDCGVSLSASNHHMRVDTSLSPSSSPFTAFHVPLAWDISAIESALEFHFHRSGFDRLDGFQCWRGGEIPFLFGTQRRDPTV